MKPANLHGLFKAIFLPAVSLYSGHVLALTSVSATVIDGPCVSFPQCVPADLNLPGFNIVTDLAIAGDTDAEVEVEDIGAARAEFTGPVSLPNLGVRASSTSGNLSLVSAVVNQTYAYSGAGSDFTLELTLDGTLFAGPGPQDVGVGAQVQAYTYNSIATTPVLVSEATSLESLSAGPVNQTEQLAFSLMDGDILLLQTVLSGYGVDGGSMDAYSSLGMTFASGDDVAGLAFQAPVPLPAGILLFLSALGVVSIFGQRRTAEAESGD